MKILDRYILRELAMPFIFGVAAFATVFIAGNLIVKFARLVTEQGVPTWQALLVFVYSLPKYLVFTFPMSALLAALLGFGRLSGEGETTAMNAGGVSFRRVMTPLVVAGCVVSLFTIAFNETVVPVCSRAADEIVARASRTGGGGEHVVIPTMTEGKIGNLLYAGAFNRGRGELRDVTYIQYSRQQPRVVIQSARALYKPDRNRWVFYDGFWQTLESQVAARVRFASQEVDLGRDPADIAMEQRKPDEMTWRELGGYIGSLTRQGRAVSELVVEWHHKLSVPFASLIFALIGAPLGLRSQRTGSALGLGYSILIIFAYYVVWNYLTILAGKGGFPAFWAAWLPNLIGLAIGALLVRRAAR